MIILTKQADLVGDKQGELGIYAQWWFKKEIPTSLQEVELNDVFEVKNVEDRGEYYERPEGAFGVIVSSSKKLAALAAWRNKEHKGPWQIYGEQEKDTTAFHLVGDSDVVFLGWV